jgi:hypothetical protein
MTNMTIALKKKHIIVAGLMGIIPILAVVALYANGTATVPHGNPMEMRYVADFSDDRNVLGVSDNVFVGKIIRTIKHVDEQNVPVTFLEAEVIHNIKGDLAGQVVILQMAGYKETEEGRLFSSLDGTALLEPGEIRLVATGYEPEISEREGVDVYGINAHPNFSELIDKDSTLSMSDLKIMVAQNKKVQAWEEAYKYENKGLHDSLTKGPNR